MRSLKKVTQKQTSQQQSGMFVVLSLTFDYSNHSFTSCFWSDFCPPNSDLLIVASLEKETL
jgi:hypothetical protein